MIFRFITTIIVVFGVQIGLLNTSISDELDSSINVDKKVNRCAVFTTAYIEASLFKKNGLFGIKNQSGEVIIPPLYRGLDCFRGDIAWAAIDEKQLWCPLELDGAISSRFPCRKYYQTLFDSMHNQVELDSDPYESTVLWNRLYNNYYLDGVGELPKIKYGF